MRLGLLTFGQVWLSISHVLSYQYMVGIIPGNAMPKALGGTSFMCSLLGRCHMQVVSYVAVGIIKGIIPGIATI